MIRREISSLHSSRPILHMYGSTSILLLLLLLQAPSTTLSQPSTNTNGSTHPSQHADQFTPSMAIIVVVLVFAFLLMAFFSVYIRFCAGDVRGGRNGAHRHSPTRARRGLHRGLDPAAIDSLPTFEYSAVKGIKLGGESLECAVCLKEFEDDETLRLLPRCNHVFHADCIGSWLVSHTTCPVCRSDLVAPDPGTCVQIPPTDTPDPAAEEEETRDVVPLRQVAVDVPDGPELSDPIQTRPIRSKFPRSHTTGHLLVLPVDNTAVERFTLRLPEHVIKEIVDGRLDRSASGARSGRGQFQWRHDRAAKSDRWAFLTAAPGFLARMGSGRSQTANQKGGKVEAGAESAHPPVFTVSTQ